MYRRRRIKGGAAPVRLFSLFKIIFNHGYCDCLALLHPGHPPSIITTIDRSIGPSSLLIAAFGESPFTGKHSSHDLVTAGPFSFSFSSIDDARLRARFHSIQPVGVCRGAKDSDSGDIVRKSINQPSP